ncbi:MAG: hypothetical protein KBS76_04955, partial [Ruminococcus sp.]|nr:hypothetical protein [Candidatus Apopatosoma intestinale]
MKRILSLILVLAMLICAFALVACGEEPAETKQTETTETMETPGSTVSSEPTETTASSETTASEPEETTESSIAGRVVIPEDPTLDGRSKHPDYMDVNFGGKEFSFIVNYGWSGGWDVYEICAEMTGDDTILDEAIDLRNKTVESLYNCKITQQQSNYDSSIHPQSFVADDMALGVCRFQFAVSLFQNHVIKNFRNIAEMDINLGHSWWDQDYIDAFTVNVDGTDVLPSLSGNFNLLNYDSTIAILVNRKLYDQLLATGKIKEDVFLAVREGRWTMQMLYETMLEASTDVNGDSQLTFEAGDVFG